MENKITRCDAVNGSYEKASAPTENPANPLEETVPLMLSSDYKKRFIAEYRQTKIRYERLKDFNNRIDAAVESECGNKKVEMPKHDCPVHMLRDQQNAMGEYLHILEVRAVIEGIDLPEA